MVQLKVNIDGIAEARKAIGAIGRRARHMRPAFLAIADKLCAGAMRNFAEAGWWPHRWPPSRTGGKTLFDTGRLHGSLLPSAADGHAMVETNVEYAAIHQFGGCCKNGSELPPRPFLPVDARGHLEPGIMEHAERAAAAWITEERVVHE